MNSPDQDEYLAKHISKALATDTESPSAETDQRILQFARQQAPVAQSVRWKNWMPAAAACCIVGVLTLSLLPERPKELIQSMEVDMQAAKSREMISNTSPQNDASLADAVSAGELVIEESEAASSASPTTFAATAAPATPAALTKADNIVRLPASFFKRLVALTEQENSAQGFSDDHAQNSSGSATLQTAKKLERRSTDTDSPSLLKARVSQDDTRSVKYEKLRSECNCHLPNSLQEALDMLASQQIQPENSTVQALGDKP